MAYNGQFELADRHKVNLISMLSWSFEFENKDYFEGFRSLSTNGIDKPVLNFFRMAALMKGKRAQVSSTGNIALDDIIAKGVREGADVDGFAAADKRQAAVMLWNYQDAEQGGLSAPVTVNIAGLPKNLSRVRLTHYRIDDTHANAYTAWKAMGSPQNPSPSQYAELKGKDGLQLLESPRWLDVKKGAITLSTDMPHHSISLLQLDW